MTENLNSEQIFKLLTSKRYITIIPHAAPDADAIGSALALYLFIQQFHSNAKIICYDKILENNNFLPHSNIIKQANTNPNHPILCFVDCSTKEQTKLKLNLEHNPLVINIDHHLSNNFFGHINQINPKAASTTEIIYDLFKDWQVQITPEMATCLLAGLHFDTGSFQHPNTTAKSLKIANQLIKLKANNKLITYNLFQKKSVPKLKLWGQVFKNSHINQKQILSSIATLKDFEKCQAKPKDLEGAIDYLNKVPNKKFSLLLTEQKEHLKGSLRTSSKEYQLNEIAKIFGGGGHQMASGFQIKGKLKSKTHWQINAE